MELFISGSLSKLVDWQRCFGTLGPVITLSALTLTVAGFGAVWLYGKLKNNEAADENSAQVVAKPKDGRNKAIVPSKVKVCYGTTTGMAKVSFRF